MSSGNGCGRGGRGEALRRAMEARQPGAANQAQPGEANPAQAGEANPSQQLGGQPTPMAAPTPTPTPAPIGRGSAQLLQMLRRPRPPEGAARAIGRGFAPAAATAEAAPGAASAPAPGLGRAQMLQQLLGRPATSSPPVGTPAPGGGAPPPGGGAPPPGGGAPTPGGGAPTPVTRAPTPATGAGAAPAGPPQAARQPSAAHVPGPDGDQRRPFLSREAYMVERMSLRGDPIVRKGEDGQAKNLAANYIRIKCRNEGVFQYAVTFSPNVDSRNIRRKIIGTLEGTLGNVRSFDGAILFLPIRLPMTETICHAEMPTDNSPLQVVVTLVKVLPPEQCVQLYNIVFKDVMRRLKLVQVGRHYYDPNGSISVPQHRLEIWPGYVTAIQEFEGGLMLVLDVSHRVLRTETVLDVMRDVQRRARDNFQEEVVKRIVGNTVLTRYNNKTYRVDDIDWKANPSSSFELSTGESISYLQYYKKSYGRDIQDARQPILVHKPKPPRGPPTQKVPQKPDMISLIPELCYTTGLTDDMRADFRVMKDLAAHTRVSPEGRQTTMRAFIRNVNSHPEARGELEKWGLVLEPDVMPLTGRQFAPEKIKLNRQEFSAGPEADWGRAIGKDGCISPKNLQHWVVIFTMRDKPKVMDFVNAMKQHAPPLGMKVAEPMVQELPNDRTESYLTALKNSVSPQTDLVVTIFPTSRDDRYNAVKKYCYVEHPIASQCINTRTIAVKEKLRSVVQKILLQINCKLGGTLWAVHIPIKSIMVVGIDVYHDGKGRNAKSVGGLVASMNPACTAWYSRVAFQDPGQELIDTIKIALVQCLRKFHEVNHCMPQTIVVFRDGVGDGQLNYVSNHEVPQLTSTFATFGETYNPRFALLVVQKRINTRIFGQAGRDLSNPGPGTIVDHSVTRRDLFDFFLVSQHVRQGTVTPTHYVVANESGNWKVDHLQRLTYKMTHLYYNWPGTIRVPAPCQYAHKLAQMVGMNLRKVPAEVLCDRLFYL